MVIGSYYVQIKNAHIFWGEMRRTTTRGKRAGESYIAIPANYAYEYNIKKGERYVCLCDNGKKYNLKAAGSQNKREFAKQFQGDGSLKVLYEWYKYHDAQEGDYVLVSIFDDKSIAIEYVSKEDVKRLNEYGIAGERGRMQEVEERKEKGFRLLLLLVKDGDVEHCNIEFIKSEYDNSIQEPITTVLIGVNGSGKSFVLKTISEIFNAIQNSNAMAQLKYSHYEMKYVIDGNVIQLQILNREVYIYVNGALLQEHDVAVFPDKALGVSFMLNDKFPFKQASGEGIYEYLGIRMASNASWTSSMNNKLADSFLELAEKGQIWEYIESLSSFLSIDSKISLSCEMSVTDFEAENLDIVLKKYAESILKQDDYRRDKVQFYSEKTYQKLHEFIVNIREKENYIRVDGKIIFGLEIDKNSVNDMKEVGDVFLCFKELADLKIIKNMTLNLYKNGKKYSFDEASSGEKHILYSFTNIYNCIKKNSIILIDEPEISLHPEWQIKYISFLKKVFAEYSSCHFIIASHSHYIVSDLDPRSSSLITIEMKDGRRSFSTVEYSTYAWSAENILYNIFEVRTFRNYYFDMDVRELVCAISNNKKEDIDRIKILYRKLSNYLLDSRDPLNLIIEEAKEYIKNVEFGESC